MCIFDAILLAMRNISMLSVGQSAVITDIKPNDTRMKLMEMGCIPGTTVTLIRKSPFNGPIAIEIFGYILSMRLEDARHILIA